MNLCETLLTALRDRGATEVFGTPGDFALPFFADVERSRILPLYAFSHEPAVGFAADAAARYRGGIGVAAVTYGAGALNMVNAVAGACAERVPVADQVRLDDAARAPAQIARVLANARRSSRPVYIAIPRDMTGAACGPVMPMPPELPEPDAVKACADAVLARLRSAQRPVLVVGVEVRRYGLEKQVAELARRLNLPTVTSFMGRGLLAGADAPLIGTYLGVAGEARVTEASKAPAACCCSA